MIDHDGPLGHQHNSPESEAIGSNRFLDSVDRLPRGVRWELADVYLTQSGLYQVGEGGTSSAHEFYTRLYGDSFVLVRSPARNVPDPSEPAFDVYGDRNLRLRREEAMSPEEIEDILLFHNMQAMRELYEILGKYHNGQVLENSVHVKDGWQAVYQHASYAQAETYVQHHLADHTKWYAIPIKDERGMIVAERVTLWAEPLEQDFYQREVPGMTQRRTSSGSWLSLINGGKENR